MQAFWYQKLKEDGFKEIESISFKSRPLKEWHNIKFTSKRFQIIQATRSQYQRQVEDFINHPSFKEACKFMASHGNCKFSEMQIQMIWEMHSQGMTRRKIAQEFNRVKSRIDDVIKGLTQWMKLI